jgi:hypothetical protein
MAAGAGYGPNYQNPPGDANSGFIWSPDNSIRVNWWNWYDEDSKLWYYAYQLTNNNFQPHVGSFLMFLPAQTITNFEGDARTLGNHPVTNAPYNFWNEYVAFNIEAVPPYKVFGWAADNTHELPTNRSTSGNPLFEMTSPNAPGPVTFKFSDYDYDELMGMGGTDPFILFEMPGPIAIPAHLRTVEYRFGAPSPGYQWIDQITFESWLQVRIENIGEGDAYNVTATITGAPANVTIVDGDVTAGDILSGSSAWSTDTFKLQVDMSEPQDPNEGIVWRIEYDDSEGNHHVIENVPQFPEPDSCIDNSECGSGEFCKKPLGGCEGQGGCEPTPEICPTLWDPVCGCDGKTYPNECAADVAGVNIAYKGECVVPSPDSASSCATVLPVNNRLPLWYPQATTFKLYPNYPNPFNPETWIPYQIAKDAYVTVRIFDIRGQLIKTIDLGHKEAGFYISQDKAAYWDGRNQFGEKVSSGVYFYTLRAGGFTATRRMLIMK